MPTSPDTILRRVRETPERPVGPVRVLGVDDWAIRRGQRYGTILCDLERGRPVDLLAERSGEALRLWLRGHPEVEIISRDRADDYIKGASEGAPQAVQVADRWHLLRNCHEALGRVVDRYQATVRESAQAMLDSRSSTPAIRCDTAAPAIPVAPQVPLTRRRQRQEQRRARRLECYQQVKELHGLGISLRAIADRLGMHRSTARRLARAPAFPERSVPAAPQGTGPWTEYLQRRWQQGCRNAARLTTEIKAMGFRGSYYMVQRRLARWRKALPSDGASAGVQSKNRRLAARPSSRQVTWILLRKESDLKAEERAFLRDLGARSPPLQAAGGLAREFTDMIRQRRSAEWHDWLRRACAPQATAEIRSFAKGLQADEAAVQAALTLPWSNGPVEGHINRLKMIKRQMYGRANFDLLRQRVLHQN
jgi:transposase